MKIEISNGELLDKITILQTKLFHIKDDDKRKNVSNEFNILWPEVKTLGVDVEYSELHHLFGQLRVVNNDLWMTEDKLRVKEKNKEFDDEFIQLARSVYFTNDKRAEIKKKINILTNSDLVEEKSYEKYN